MKNLLLIVNPVSGKMKAKSTLMDVVMTLQKCGYTVTVKLTEQRGHATEFSAKAKADGFDAVVCFGGDGTLNETISGLIKSYSETPLGYIPLGTTNDFAKTLGISSSPFESAYAITKGKIKKIDCGYFNGKTFVYVAATGAFTEASYGATPAEKRYLGSLAYIIKGIESLTKLKPFHLKAKVNDEIIEGDYLYASVSNTTSLGGIFKLDPQKVKIDDGFFELVLIKAPSSLSEKGKLVSGLITENLNSEYVDLIYAPEIKIKLDAPMPWSLDGENGGEHKEIIIKNVSKKINFIGIQ